MTFHLGLATPANPSEESHWFVFRSSQLLVRHDENSCTVIDSKTVRACDLPAAAAIHVGTLNGVECFALDLPDDMELPCGWLPTGLRLLHGQLPQDLYLVAGRAYQLVEWERTHGFCGRCGTPTERSRYERSRFCSTCGYTSYPRLSPVVIALIEHRDRILLIRGRDFPEPIYGPVAGFVEPGESLEEALAREVREEVGLKLVDSRYFGSQPWPFPHSLMIGFRATAASEHLEIDPSEVVDAGWFTRERLPRLPADLSISRWMIDAWLNARREENLRTPQGHAPGGELDGHR